MAIIYKYSKEALLFLKLLGVVIVLVEDEPKDVLGELYMKLNLGNAKTGQFFTPNSVSKLMAKISYDNDFKELKQPFIILSEPACVLVA
jgi:type I restriction-modification system DNA methylase subunit